LSICKKTVSRGRGGTWPHQAHGRLPPLRLIGYARVSTEEQGTDPQLDELHAAGCNTLLEEHASGADRSRPVLARLLRDIRAGETLVLVRLARLACSVSRLRPRQSGGASHNGAVDVVFTTTDRLGLCNFSNFVAQSHSSHKRCVRFSPAVTGRIRNTRYRAARYTLPGRDFHPLDRASFAWRTRCYLIPSL